MEGQHVKCQQLTLDEVALHCSHKLPAYSTGFLDTQAYTPKAASAALSDHYALWGRHNEHTACDISAAACTMSRVQLKAQLQGIKGCTRAAPFCPEPSDDQEFVESALLSAGPQPPPT